jgi:hypothetical protein
MHPWVQGGFAKGQLDHVGSYRIEPKEPVEVFLEFMKWSMLMEDGV